MSRGSRSWILRWSFAAFIAYASALTFLTPGHAGHAAAGIRLLAGAEFLAAVAFATGLFDIASANVLFSTFAIAAVITVLEGEWPLRFAYFAATVYFLVAERKATSNPPIGSTAEISKA